MLSSTALARFRCGWSLIHSTCALFACFAFFAIGFNALMLVEKNKRTTSSCIRSFGAQRLSRILYLRCVYPLFALLSPSLPPTQSTPSPLFHSFLPTDSFFFACSSTILSAYFLSAILGRRRIMYLPISGSYCFHKTCKQKHVAKKITNC